MEAAHIARWDLDKTYLRTEFDSLKDLLRTALERADEKRTNPGAGTLLRELTRSNVSVHILSGSPEQMRQRLEEKLRLDGIEWQSFTLKQNLKNMLRLRFRALRDQLGYKLPALLLSRTHAGPSLAGVRESLFGDDAEADAFVYALYADIMQGRIEPAFARSILERGRVYEDVIEQTLATFARIEPEPVVERIFIHLEQQTHPREFEVYGGRVLPFYNYMQPAYVMHEDGRLSSLSVLRVAGELVTQHRFDGEALARSYGDMARRGHLAGTKLDELEAALPIFLETASAPMKNEVRKLVALLGEQTTLAQSAYAPLADDSALPDYLSLVGRHNLRRKKQ